MSLRKSVLITGASGYIGLLTVKTLVADKKNIETIVALDNKPTPKEQQLEGVVYIQGDIRDKKIGEIFVEHKIDTVVHLVTIIATGKKDTRDFEYSVDVLGTQNLLDACIKHQVSKLIVTSSGAAYGYYKDNPDWIVETDEIRGNYEMPYANHKRLVEEMLAESRSLNPALKILILRPGTILGEHTDNLITDLFKKKIAVGVIGSEIPFVFIWDMDVVNVVVKGVYEDNEGTYNLAGDGAVTMGEIAKETGQTYIKFPAWLLKTGLFIFQKLGLSQYGPNQINFLRYRPVLSNKKLKEEFNYIPKYSSKAVFDLYLKANS